jgi:uncharacterized membrane protein YgdD (TMEM256/DUF423 family)
MSNESKVFAVVGCIFLATAVILAAFGFHGPAEIMSPEKMPAWNWAVEMQYYHGVGLIVIAMLMHVLGKSWLISISAVMMTLGIFTFAGLIYAKTLGAPEWVGELVPIGGFLLMFAWLFLALGVLRN